jgi:hypothetical protein
VETSWKKSPVFFQHACFRSGFLWSAHFRLILPAPLRLDVTARVARWYIFKPKISIWVNFGGYWNERFWRVLEWKMLLYFGLFYGHLVYFVAIWYK